METAGISSLLERGAEGPHFDPEHAWSAGTAGEIVAFLPEIAVGNKNDSEPTDQPGSRERSRQMTRLRQVSVKLEPESRRLVIKHAEDIVMDATQARLKAEIAEFVENQDLKRRDLWLFAPLLAVLVALPLAIVAVLSVGLWFAARTVDLSMTSPAPTTFAARWPDRALPETLIR
jgi:hypothetical protein